MLYFSHAAGNPQWTSLFSWKNKNADWVQVEAYSVDAIQSGNNGNQTEIPVFGTSARYEFFVTVFLQVVISQKFHMWILYL